MLRTVFLSLILAGCATVPPAAVGHDIYHYVRSNRDGSESEHVVQYRPSRSSIAVYKWVEKCTTAAYVTATMDVGVRDGREFIAGKVGKDGRQARFGTLTLDPAGPALVADVTPPGGPRIEARHALQSRPYLLYDFDFADLNAFLQEARPRADFAYELPVIWPDENGIFRDYGRMTARFVGAEVHLGRPAIRFDLTVDGAVDTSGTLWIDEARGFIIEAELGLPNHQEYRDFRLKLARVEGGGQAAWERLVTGHYAGCPTGN